MEIWVIYITSETFCDERVNKVLMATLRYTGCFILILTF